jgi:hypothetical protein
MTVNALDWVWSDSNLMFYQSSYKFNPKIKMSFKPSAM